MLSRATTWLADEIPPSRRFVEGASIQVLVNRYERDPRARRACLAHWGWDCTVCGFNFARRYGALGEGFMHVHHLRDLASLGGAYEVNPVEDLRPVCPNCHAMLHRQRPALPIAELRQQLTRSSRRRWCKRAVGPDVSSATAGLMIVVCSSRATKETPRWPKAQG